MISQSASQGPTRRRLLLSGAAVLGALSLTGSTAGPASAVGPSTDGEILTGLLAVELLSISVVNRVLASRQLRPRARRLARRIGLQERIHAAALDQELNVLGIAAPLAPRGVSEIDRQLAAHHTDRRLEGVHDEHSGLDLLLAMESIAEGALYMAMSKLHRPALITLGARLLACEAQHEAALGALRAPKDADQSTPYSFVEGIS